MMRNCLIRQRLVHGNALPCIRRIIPDVDVSTLDAGHILPDMAPPNRRGIWFPMGTEPKRDALIAWITQVLQGLGVKTGFEEL